jgi:hypothetical protein
LRLPGNDVVRESRPAAIELYESAEARKTSCEPRQLRPLPGLFDVEDEPGYEHEIARPVTDDLVGDVDAVARLRVASLRDVHTWHPSTDHLQPQPHNAGTPVCTREPFASRASTSWSRQIGPDDPMQSPFGG